MAAQNQFVDYVLGLLDPFDPVKAKAMPASCTARASYLCLAALKGASLGMSPITKVLRAPRRTASLWTII